MGMLLHRHLMEQLAQAEKPVAPPQVEEKVEEKVEKPKRKKTKE